MNVVILTEIFQGKSEMKLPVVQDDLSFALLKTALSDTELLLLLALKQVNSRS